MVKKGQVIKYEYSPSQVLWGITTKGLGYTHLTADQEFDWKHFQPSKVNLSLLSHTLDIQYIHVQCIKNNLRFISGSKLGMRDTMDKVPDAIIYAQQGTIAIEVERHIKSKRRYNPIVYNYLKAIKQGLYQKILYVAPTERQKEAIKKSILNLGYITADAGSSKIKYKLEKSYLDFFGFTTLDNICSILEKLVAAAKVEAKESS